MRSFKIVAGIVVLSLVMPLAAAGLLPEPATATAVRQDDLFRIINGIAIVIGVIVEVLLVVFLVKFYRNRNIPRGETHRGNTKAEIAWTFAPVAILVFIGYLSVQVMEETDVPYAELLDQDAIEIQVYGNQFVWEFRYPEGPPTYGEMRVQENTLVVLNLTSRDVGHAFRVPEFGIMIDTWPNRWNTVHFTAPAYKQGGGDNGDYIPNDDPNSYFVQCQEYCGSGHAYMHGKIVVFPAGSQPLPYGAADALKDTCAEPLGDRQLVDVVLKESGGSGGAPWSIDPSTMSFAPGAKVRFQASIEGSGVHNLAFAAPIDQKTPDFQPPAVHCLDVDMPAEPQQIEYVCAVPGHAGLGMRGTLTLG